MSDDIGSIDVDKDFEETVRQLIQENKDQLDKLANDNCEKSTKLEPIGFALITERETPSYREGDTVSVSTYSGGHGVEPSYAKEQPLFTAGQISAHIHEFKNREELPGWVKRLPIELAEEFTQDGGAE